MTHRIQQSGPPGTGRSRLSRRTALWLGAVCCLPLTSSAQFLRLGIFDLASEASLDVIYTTNVEGVRPSETEEEQTDYYLVPAIGLNGTAPFGRGTTLTLDTSFGMEKHIIRTDLDSETAPFGRFRLDTQTELARYSINLYGGFEREFAEGEDVYVPGNRKTRDINDTFEYGGNVIWSWRSLKLGGNYDFTMERHLDPSFQDGDRDETSLGFDATLQLRENLSLGYTYEQTLTELITDPDDDPNWEVDESVKLDWQLPLFERPTVTYSLGVERESLVEDPEEEGQGDWELTHNLTMDGDWEVFPAAGALRLRLNASYQFERNPEDDDIQFTYGADLEHDISSTARQSLSLKREPVETFGSKNDTDRTTVDYQYMKDDVLIYGLSLLLTAGWSRDQPTDEGAEEERIVDFGLTLAHTRALSRRLARDIMYEYTLEDSSLEDELLIEHRVTLTFTYTF